MYQFGRDSPNAAKESSEDSPMEARRGGGIINLLWLVAVVVIAILLAEFVSGAVGGIVGVILAVIVFLLVIREA
jgi:hypothetical protein